MRNLVFLFTLLISSTSAFAHGGHVGELAGHAHWIGVAAALGAAALAGLMLKGKKGKEAEAVEEETADAEDEAGETA